MIAQFTMDIGAAIVAMATLSYLGLGIQPPDADWGTLLEMVCRISITIMCFLLPLQ